MFAVVSDDIQSLSYLIPVWLVAVFHMVGVERDCTVAGWLAAWEAAAVSALSHLGPLFSRSPEPAMRVSRTHLQSL